jgi:hypothetical protein
VVFVLISEQVAQRHPALTISCYHP